MLIYFVRHGQTDWNKTLRWQGRSDIVLNKTGILQAHAIRNYFSHHHIIPSAIVSSPMQRATKTAGIIAKSFAMNISKEPTFVELELGDFEGLTTDELKARYGQVFDFWLSQHHSLAAPGGENIQQAIERMQARLMSHIKTHGDKLLIVAHQAIIIAMKAALSGVHDIKTLASYKQANFEIDAWDVERAIISHRIDINQVNHVSR